MYISLKKNWFVLLILLIISVILIIYFSFILDIGINSKYFVKRDFNTAFIARKTGNCEVFKSYIYNDKDKWGKRCINEKDLSSDAIDKFFIKGITINGNDAFIQVQLLRNIPPSIRIELNETQLKALSEGYLVNYDLIKVNSDKFLWILPKSRWLIKNELR